MHYRTALASTYLRVGAAASASVLLMGLLSLSARASTFQMVDAQTLTGDMVLSPAGDPSYADGEWTFPLQASNTGSQTYNDVNLVEQFVWDNANIPGSENALTWNTSGGTWGLVEPAENFAISNVTGAGTLNPVLFSLDRSNVNTPLSYPAPYGGQLATILSTDSVPDIELGNFGPGVSKVFTLTCPSNISNPAAVGFFVAVPEPSTFALLAVGGAGLLGYGWRRRRAKP